MIAHYYDTHLHLDLLKNRAAIIHEIEENQINTIAVTNLPDLFRKETADVKSKYIRFALGFHPELVHQFSKQIPLMWELLPKAKYIGEVGLDFVDVTKKHEQIAFFRELVERCRYDSNKILTIHSRRAVREVLDIIGDNFGFSPILHWFTGNKEQLVEAIEKGFYISINGAMMASKKFVSMLPLIPSKRILIETDIPFTYIQGTYKATLNKVVAELTAVRKDVDVWSNFRTLLTRETV